MYKRDTVGQPRRTLYRLVHVADEWDRPTPVFKDRLWDSVPSVIEIGFHESSVFGKTTDGYFICDAVSNPGGQSRTGAKETFLDSSESAWLAELKARGVPAEKTLQDPETWAGVQSDRELRPWRYRYFGNLLGLSDEDWSNEVQLTFLGASFLVGLLRRRRDGLRTVAIWLGVGANVVGPFGLGGGGPVGLVGFVILPLEAVVLAAIGRWLRRVTDRKRGESSGGSEATSTV